MNKMWIALLIAFQSFDFAEAKVTSLGAHSCDQWSQNRFQASKSSAPIERIGALFGETWILGFMSGINAAWPEVDLLETVDANLVFDWVDKHCAKNPKDNLFKAGNALALELDKVIERRKGPRK